MDQSYRALALARLTFDANADPRRNTQSNSAFNSWSSAHTFGEDGAPVVLLGESASQRPSSLCSEPLDDDDVTATTAPPTPMTGVGSPHAHSRGPAAAQPLLPSSDLRRSGVHHAIANICAEVMGAGVLSLPHAAAVLGWIPALATVVFFAASSAYAGLLLTRAKLEGYPHAESFAELATCAVGPRFGAFTRAAILTQWALLLPYFLITAVSSLHLALPDARVLLMHDACFVEWAMLVAALLLLPLQLQTMHSLSTLSTLSTIAMLVAVLLVLSALNLFYIHHPHIEPLPPPLDPILQPRAGVGAVAWTATSALDAPFSQAQPPLKGPPHLDPLPGSPLLSIAATTLPAAVGVAEAQHQPRAEPLPPPPRPWAAYTAPPTEPTWDLWPPALRAPTGVRAEDVLDWAGAVCAILFAFQGQSVFLEIMREMKQPHRFGRAVQSATLGMGVLYALTIGIGYGTCGSTVRPFLPESMQQGAAKRVVGFLLALHVAVCYLIIGQPLHRAVHGAIYPRDSAARQRSRRPSGHLRWLTVTALVLAFSLAIALSVPSFDKFQSLLGALTGTPSVFGWPPLFFLRSRAACGEKARPIERFLCAFFLLVLLPGLALMGTVKGLRDVALHWEYRSFLAGC